MDELPAEPAAPSARTRVVHNAHALTMLDTAGVKGTFFVQGLAEEPFPT
ncbi:MAG TPA: hypothetical protein VES79_08745 [Solirubrobacteraceae bacterium]|nr:hypothetical protein [Solirubrobacteraceae bacterium]